ncbi:MAG TPA: DNA recombination protein RmuC [Candidatus Ventricola intestinavium]|nr:DNA recombination protein RmuC [Candidatus Ventricola intestinavium]
MSYFAGISDPLLLGMVVLCLLLVIIMLSALLLLHRRTQQAERQMREISTGVEERLTAADERARQSGAQASQEISEALQNANDSMMRMMGEMLRSQQGQMDSLGGQLRAAGRQEEERLERMRQTVDRRLNAYEEKLGGVTRALDDRLAGSDDRLDRMCVSLENGLAHIREENRAQLEQMRLTVDEKLNATVDQRLEDSFAAVTRRLEQVTESLNAMKTLAGTVDELGKIIGGAQPLGMVGEAQLGTLLSQMLAPQQYAQHASVRPGGEPVADYVVVMPGQEHGHTVYLPIDASLPLREYQELCTVLASGTREQVDSARGLLESAVRMHARRMSEKLIAPPYTTDYAVLFLSSEGLFAEILHISGLSERIQRESRMVIAGPTTLAALLTSLQMGFRSLAIEQRTGEIMSLLGAVRTDLAGFAASLSRTQKKLRQASEDLESAQKHSQTIARRLSDVSELPAEEADRLLEGEKAGEGRSSPFDEEEDEWD